MAYQKDISAVLGLSVSTVSKVLNGYPDISEETRQKVLKTAEELDYNFKREDAPELPPGLWDAIGVLAPGFTEKVKRPYYRELLYGMTKKAAECGRDLVIMGENTPEQEMSWIGRVTARRIGGICLLASRDDLYKGRFADLLESGIPLISVENEVTGHTSVCSDFRSNAELIMKYLEERGHRTAVFPGDQSISYRRYASILSEEAGKLGMECLGMESQLLASETVMEAAKKEGFTCVIFQSCREAACRIREWEENGLRIPEDLSVAVLQARWEERSAEEERIACASNPPYETGKEAVQRLVYILEHPERNIGEKVSLEGMITDGETVRDFGGNPARKF